MIKYLNSQKGDVLELVYLWVEDYKNIKKQGFNFSPRFRCEYDDVKKELTIDENDDYISDFFGENINVTAIVGKNGSGKSSVLELINENGYKNYNLSPFPIAHMELKLLTIYYDNQSDKIYLVTQIINPLNPNIVNNTNKYIQRQQSSEENSFQKTLMKPSLSRTQDDYFKLLDFVKNNDLEFPFFVPNTINFGVCDDSWDLLELIKKDDSSTVFDNFQVFDENKVNRLKMYHILLLLAYLNNHQITFNIESDDYDNIIVELNSFIKDNKIKEKIESFIKIVNEHSLDGFIASQNYIKMNKLSNDFFISYIEITNYFSNKSKKVFLIEFFPILSDGEYQFLYLFSQIYSSLQEEKILLLIDEGESFLHPNWQKKYLSYIVQFLKDNFPNRKIHIILTSHSPFLLSDIPKQNIIFLDKDENGNCKVVDGLKEKKQTFGANIHTLLSDSFFMEDGLMGEFAKGKIDDVINYLHGKESKIKNNNEAQKLIHIIGEPIVKNQLQRMLDSKRLKKVDEIDAIKKSMEAMQKRLDELDR